MRITKNDIPTKIDAPGAHARRATDFGDASDYGSLDAGYFSLGAGTDIAPLLEGLHDNACHAPHWGYMISGEVVVSYTDGTEESCAGNDVFYWPAGHSVRVVSDAEVILFSPQAEHGAVMDHMLARMAG
ncbi:MAG: cupin domain-containing protein [Acidimicrobiales bacterium]